MLDSVQLSLMIGPIFPMPVPRAVLDALAEVEVTVKDVGTSGFHLTFSIEKQSPLQILFLLTGGLPLLFMRVVIVATLNGVSSVLIDGVITNNELSPGDKGSNSTLRITGEDLTALMNQSNGSGIPFPACPAEVRVLALLARYALYGVVPLVIPSLMVDIPLPIDRIPSQKGTDLRYIQHLAAEAGYVFYLDPGPAGFSKAYWGPQIKVGAVQPALNSDMDAYTNVESLSFKFDQQKNKLPILYIYIEETGITIPIPVPPITPLNPPLGLIPPLPTNLLPPDMKSFRDDLAKRPIPQSIMIGLAEAAEAAEAVSCEGSLDVTRYGRILNARQLVGVRGAGLAFDGVYYVKSVTHRIKRGEYKQSFTLTRNGLVSTFSNIPT
jgi:hypothetical protein